MGTYQLHSTDSSFTAKSYGSFALMTRIFHLN